MTTFVDTSALLAVIDRDDGNHAAADRRWKALLEGTAPLVTTNYVAVETCAIVQHRLGFRALVLVTSDVLPALSIQWIDDGTHAAAIAALLAAGRRRLSLVDCVSFEVMRRLGIRRCFAFDPHFEEQGFQPIR